MQLIMQPGTTLRVKRERGGIRVLNIKARTTEANWDFLGKLECTTCRSLVPSKDFRIDNISCLESC